MTQIDHLEPRTFFSGGAVDTTFGLGSSAVNVQFKVARGETASLSKIVSDSGGRTYVLAPTGRSGSDKTTLQIRRLTAAGTLDGGWVKTKSNNAIFRLGASLQAYKTVPQIDALVDSKDRLTLLLGTKVYRFAVSGTLDSTFGKKGVATLSGLTSGGAMTIDSGGRIYVVGNVVGTSSSANLSYTKLYRLTSNGQADASFAKAGSYGIATDNPAGAITTMNNAVAVRVLVDGSVIVLTAASYTVANSGVSTLDDFTGTQVARFTPAGKLDTTYGKQGIAVDFGGEESPSQYSFNKADPAAVRSDGSVVIYHHGGDEQTSFGYNEVISPDGNAVKRVHFTPGDAHIIHRDANSGLAVQVIAQADGSELVADPNAGLFRLSKNGAYDSTFNGGSPVNGVQAAAFEQDKTVTVAVYRPANASITIGRIFRDNRPVATLIAEPLTKPSKVYSFYVQYRAAGTIDDSSIAADGVRVTAANGRYRYATLVGTTLLADRSLIAKYQLTNFAGDGWDASNNATYSLAVLDGAVKDENGNAVQRRILGTLTVTI